MNGVKCIIKKELTRVFTDKKLVFSLFIMPVFLIVGMYFLIGQLQTSMQDDIEKHISTVYIQNEPEGFQDIVTTVNYDANIQYLAKDTDVTDIKNNILNGDTDLLVVFEDDFLNKVKNYDTNNIIPEVKTYYNNSEDYSVAARENFVALVLGSYQQQLLLDRVGNLNVLTAFQIDKDPASSIIVDNEKATGKLFGTLLPYLLTFMLFVGAMSLGVDAITGEKERGTMASMLLTPLKREEIVLGKLISLSILSSLSAAVYGITLIASMPFMLKSLGDGATEGLSIKFTVVQMLELLVIMLILVYLYVAIVSLVAVLAKTAKEATTYVSPIYIVVLAVGMITMFTGNSEIGLGMYAIPIYGNAVAIQSLLVGELTPIKFGLSVGGTALLAVVLTLLITKAFNSEKVMFNA